MIRDEKLDALITLSGKALIDEDVKEFENTDTSQIELPKSLGKSIQRLIKKESRKKEYSKLYQCAKRCVAVLLVTCTLLFAVLMSVDATREAIVRSVVGFFDEYLSISFNSAEGTEENQTVGRPEWECVVAMDIGEMYIEEYTYNGDKMMTYQKRSLNDTDKWLDNKNANAKEITVNGLKGYLLWYSDKQRYTLVWNDNQFNHSIKAFSSDITKEELIKWAEAIG